jgi:hypothetical protein
MRMSRTRSFAPNVPREMRRGPERPPGAGLRRFTPMVGIFPRQIADHLYPIKLEINRMIHNAVVRLRQQQQNPP